MGAASATVTLLMLLPSSTSYQLNVDVSSNTEGGLVAVSPGQPSRPSLSTTLSPSAALAIGTHNLALSLSYNLRLFRRFEFGEIPQSNNPNIIPIPEIPRFLLNHTVGVGTDYSLARGWSISLVGSASIGEVDAPAAAGVLSGTDGTLGTGQNGGRPGQGTNQGMGAPGASQATIGGVPTDDGVVDALTLNASARFGGQLTPEYSFEVGVRLNHTRSLTGTSSSAIVGFSVLPEQTSLSITSLVGFQAGRRNNFSVGAGVDFTYTGDGGGSFRNLSATLGYGRTLGPSTSLSTRVGVFAIQVIDPPEAMVLGAFAQDTVSPLVDLSLDYTLLTLRAISIAGTFGAGLQGTANPVTGAFEPRATANLNLGFTLPPRLGFGLTSAFSAPAAYGDREIDMSQMLDPNFLDSFLIGETTFQSAATVNYSVANGFNIGGGLRFSTFAPRIGAEGFGFANPTYTAFVTVRLGASQAL